MATKTKEKVAKVSGDDRAAGGEMASFYQGQALLKKRMYGTAPSFKREGSETTVLSVTRCTGQLDKSKALIPWAVGLVGTHMRSAIELSTAPHFLKDEIFMLIGEAIAAPDRAKEAGADTGKLIHDYAHDFAKMKIAGEKGTPSLDHLDESKEEHAKAINGISAFLDWYNANEVEFLEMEKMVYYNSWLSGETKEGEKPIEFYGYVDLIARVNGKLAVVDYKSSKGIYNEQRYQVAGYRKAYNETVLAEIPNGKKATDLSDLSLIVNFNKVTGELMTKEVSDADFAKDYQAFLGLYAVACRERELEKEYKDSKKN